ncbi:MAG: hypothetical protein HY331_06530 [Chloroflexi bacterium]|nr:hypothetical protein [Chloroflexota bacterium]
MNLLILVVVVGLGFLALQRGSLLNGLALAFVIGIAVATNIGGRRGAGPAAWLFSGFFALYAAAAILWLLLGVAPALTAASPTAHAALHRLSGGEVPSAATSLPGLLAALAGRIADVSHHAQTRPPVDHTDSDANPIAYLGGQPVGQVALEYLFSATNLALGVFLIRLRPQNRVARLLALGMVGTAASFNREAHAVFEVVPALVNYTHDHFHLVGGVAYVLALLLFPDGQLPRWSAQGWWRWPQHFLALTLTFLGVVFGGISHGSPAEFVVFFGLLVPLVGIVSQAFRRQHGLAAERQQSRVLMLALTLVFGVGLVLAIIPLALDAIGSGFPGETRAQLDHLAFRVFPPLFALIPLTLFSVVLRYRLWDIDRVIHRGLVYGVLTVSLGLLFFGGVVLLQQFFHPFTRGSEPAIVGSTLTIAALFSPLRQRIQAFIDRRFYRQKYDAARTLAAFGTTVRDEVDLDRLADRLVTVVEETVHPTHVFLWLRGSERKTS